MGALIWHLLPLLLILDKVSAWVEWIFPNPGPTQPGNATLYIVENAPYVIFWSINDTENRHELVRIEMAVQYSVTLSLFTQQLIVENLDPADTQNPNGDMLFNWQPTIPEEVLDIEAVEAADQAASGVNYDPYTHAFYLFVMTPMSQDISVGTSPNGVNAATEWFRIVRDTTTPEDGDPATTVSGQETTAATTQAQESETVVNLLTEKDDGSLGGDNKINTAALAGGISAGVILLLAVGLGWWFYNKRRTARVLPIVYTDVPDATAPELGGNPVAELHAIPTSPDTRTGERIPVGMLKKYYMGRSQELQAFRPEDCGELDATEKVREIPVRAGD